MKKRFLSFVLPLLLVGVFLSPAIVGSAPTPEISDPLGVYVGEQTGLSGQDIRISVVKVINVLLGLLGLVFVVLILYAGFMWMTSAGNTEKVDTAKKILGASIIGLVIIMTAYSITRFVLINLSEVTNNQAYQ